HPPGESRLDGECREVFRCRTDGHGHRFNASGAAAIGDQIDVGSGREPQDPASVAPDPFAAPATLRWVPTSPEIQAHPILRVTGNRPEVADRGPVAGTEFVVERRGEVAEVRRSLRAGI